MPLELENAPSSFQRRLDVVLSAVNWQFALSYLEDIVVLSKSLDEHIEHVHSVLTLLSDADVNLKHKECCCFAETIDHLGHVIPSRRLEIASHNTDAISEFCTPIFLTELRPFLGLCNVF